MEKKQFNLYNEVYKRLNTIGFNTLEGGNNNYVIRYYLYKGLNNIFKKINFEQDEIDILINGKEIELYSIYDDTSFVITASEDGNKLLVSSSDNFNKFMIDEQDNAIILEENILSESGNYENVTSTTSINDPKFEMEVMDEKKTEVLYDATLTPINAKYRDTEVFAIDRIIPESKKNDSILRRIVDGLNNETLVSVKTSFDIYDVFVYADVIYSRLYEDYKKVTLSNSKKLTK